MVLGLARGGGGLALGCLVLLVACGDDPSTAPATGSTSASTTAGTGGAGASTGAGPAGGAGGTGVGGAGGAGGTEPAPSCWDTDPQAWTVSPFDASGLNGDSPDEYTMTSDGLTLFYEVGTPTDFVLYSASRTTRADPFTGGAPVSLGFVDPLPINSVWVGGGQMFFDIDPMMTGSFQLVTARAQAGVWTDVTVLSSPINKSFASADPHLTADLLRMVYVQNDGTGQLSLHLREATRSLGDPGTSFGTDTEIVFPGVENTKAVLFCPVIADDGRVMFFTSTHSVPLEAGDADLDTADIYMAVRATVDSPWSTPVKIEAFDGYAGKALCMFALTNDGCEAIFQHFPNGGMEYAKRAPSN